MEMKIKIEMRGGDGVGHRHRGASFAGKIFRKYSPHTQRNR